MARFYGLGMQADLLAGWALVREWGRIGCRGRVRADAYSDLALAEAAGRQLEAAKRRKGDRSSRRTTRSSGVLRQTRCRGRVWRSFAEPIWASGQCAAPTGRTHDRFRSVAILSGAALNPAGRSLIAPPLSIASWFLLPYRGHGSLRGRKGPPEHLVRSTGAAMSTTGSQMLLRPKALRRNRRHLRPVGQPSHPGRCSGWISVRNPSGSCWLLGPTIWLA